MLRAVLICAESGAAPSSSLLASVLYITAVSALIDAISTPADCSAADTSSVSLTMLESIDLCAAAHKLHAVVTGNCAVCRMGM